MAHFLVAYDVEVPDERPTLIGRLYHFCLSGLPSRAIWRQGHHQFTSPLKGLGARLANTIDPLKLLLGKLSVENRSEIPLNAL